MIAFGVLLAAVMGAVLGLLGGGGSILTLPILKYGLGMPTKEAIATSLLIVATTSIAGVITHAKAGNVNWRTGLIFSGFGMLGAYLGGMGAGFLSGSVLLGLFVAMMVVTAIAMLRKASSDEAQPPPEKEMAVGKIAIDGLVVGLVTGLVGAGGGFLVVPALVLFGNMGMRRAIGTSLLVITLKSFAGLAGHLSHVSINFELAGLLSVAAILGSYLGAVAGRSIDPKHLRKGFAYFVLAMAAWMAYQELPANLHQLIFVDVWPFWLGGLAIGGFVSLFLVVGGKALGISSGFEDLCSLPYKPELKSSWRFPFLAGLVIGGAIASLLAGAPTPGFAVPAFDELWAVSFPVKAGLFVLGGALIGYGTRWAGGCTSGHGIVGMAQLAPSSIISTLTFMTAGFGVTNLIIHLIGG